MNITEITKKKELDVMKELNLLQDEGYVDEFATYRDTFIWMNIIITQQVFMVHYM